jgi:hypothetical protein
MGHVVIVIVIVGDVVADPVIIVLMEDAACRAVVGCAVVGRSRTVRAPVSRAPGLATAATDEPPRVGRSSRHSRHREGARQRFNRRNRRRPPDEERREDGPVGGASRTTVMVPRLHALDRLGRLSMRRGTVQSSWQRRPSPKALALGGTAGSGRSANYGPTEARPKAVAMHLPSGATRAKLLQWQISHLRCEPAPVGAGPPHPHNPNKRPRRRRGRYSAHARPGCGETPLT